MHHAIFDVSLSNFAQRERKMRLNCRELDQGLEAGVKPKTFFQFHNKLVIVCFDGCVDYAFGLVVRAREQV